MEGGEKAIASMGLSEEVKEKNVKEREGDDAFKGVKKVKRERGSTAKERISKMPPCAAGKRSSIYRGVTRHRWTGRYEAHLWDKDSWSETQNKKGKQGYGVAQFRLSFLCRAVYLGAYDEEEAAARAYDLAALKYWGPGTNINFPVSDYSRDIEEMQRISREDYLASLRRKSSGSTRGLSKYRLAKQHSLKWETGAGRILGNKYFSPGSCSTSEEAYERAQGDYGSYGTFKNIDLSNYVKWWHTNKGSDFEPTARRATEESNSISDEKSAQGDETETSEWPGQASQIGEPYQLPLLGVRHNQKYKPSSVTALGILSQSTRFKQMLEKVSAKKEGSQSKNEKVLENAQMEKGKGKLTLPEEMVASKESETVFGAPRTSEDVNTMFPFREGQPIASIHEGNTSNTINDSLWSSFGAKTSGIGLTNCVSIC